MKLLKIIVVFFLIYFIRRFVQMYRALKTLQQNQQDNQNPPGPEVKPQQSTPNKVVDADFKVID